MLRNSEKNKKTNRDLARGRTFDIPNGGKRSKLSLRKQFKTTLGPSGIKSANRETEKNKNRIPLLLTEVKKNNTREEKGVRRKIGPSRHENSVSNISNSKSLYDWYQYLRKSGRFRFNVWTFIDSFLTFQHYFALKRSGSVAVIQIVIMQKNTGIRSSKRGGESFQSLCLLIWNFITFYIQETGFSSNFLPKMLNLILSFTINSNQFPTKWSQFNILLLGVKKRKFIILW